MIVLNESKELVRVETWDDIRSRPGFTDDLNPTEHKLNGIIGQYAFANKIRCGLSNCHTPHAKGYLVITKSGLETNIGKDCGKTYFGVDFETMAIQFDRDMRDKQARERLWDFTFKLEELKLRIKELRGGNRGADWVFRTSQQLVEAGKGVPVVVIRRINTMLKTGQTSLTIDREASAREYELEEARGGRVQRPLIITEKIADIRGLEALNTENNLRELLIVDLEENIKTFEPLNIDAMTSGELSKWSKWVGTVEQKLEKASTAVANGLVLLTSKNLEPFANIINDGEDLKKFQAYLKSLN